VLLQITLARHEMTRQAVELTECGHEDLLWQQVVLWRRLLHGSTRRECCWCISNNQSLNGFQRHVTVVIVDVVILLQGIWSVYYFFAGTCRNYDDSVLVGKSYAEVHYEFVTINPIMTPQRESSKTGVGNVAGPCTPTRYVLSQRDIIPHRRASRMWPIQRAKIIDNNEHIRHYFQQFFCGWSGKVAQGWVFCTRQNSHWPPC